MGQIYASLAGSILFQGLTIDEVRTLAGGVRFDVRAYARDQVVAVEGEPCTAIGVIVSGSVHVQRAYPSGRIINIDTLEAGNSFGEALIFSDRGRYPATVVAHTDASVAYLSRDDVIRLCAESPTFLRNFMRMLSDRVLMLNEKIKGLSYGTVRQKVANFILDERRRQDGQVLHLRLSRGEMADALGIPQPSLSRELAAMKEEGWIDFERRTIRILNQAALERSLT